MSADTKKTAAQTDGDRRNAKSTRTRQRIIAAATELFLEDGYSNTSLDQVAAKAEVTKPTVYSHFQSKQGLFDSVIKHFTAGRIEKVTVLLTPSEDPKTDLIKFGDFFLARTFEKETLGWKRLATTESTHHPEVGAAFFQAGPVQLLSRLERYFELQTEEGRLCIEDFGNSAEQFIGMLLGIDLVRAEVGLPVPSAAKCKRRCRETVETFLAAYGVEK